MIRKRKFTRGGQWYEFKDDCPQCIIDLFMSSSNSMTFEFYLKYKEFFPNTKRFYVTGICDICKKEARQHMSSFKRRTLVELKHKLVCSKCIRKAVSNDKDWKLKNSNAQIIVQNKPDVKLKNSNSLKKTWSDPKIRKKWHIAIKKSNQSLEKRQKNSHTLKEKIKNDDKYRDKILNNWNSFRGISGHFYSKINGKIRFDSSFEFCYLLDCDFKNINTKRCTERLLYTINNNTKYYKPDFIENEEILKEIKSSYTKNKYQTKEELKQKKKVALKYCREKGYKFRLLTEKEIKFLRKLRFLPYLLTIFQQNKAIVLYKQRTYTIVLSNKFYAKAQKVYEKWNLSK